MFSNKETKGIFWYEIKKFEKKKLAFFFNLKPPQSTKKLSTLQALSKFWVGKKICDDPTDSST